MKYKRQVYSRPCPNSWKDHLNLEVNQYYNNLQIQKQQENSLTFKDLDSTSLNTQNNHSFLMNDLYNTPKKIQEESRNRSNNQRDTSDQNNNIINNDKSYSEVSIQTIDLCYEHQIILEQFKHLKQFADRCID